MEEEGKCCTFSVWSLLLLLLLLLLPFNYTPRRRSRWWIALKTTTYRRLLPRILALNQLSDAQLVVVRETTDSSAGARFARCRGAALLHV